MFLAEGVPKNFKEFAHLWYGFSKTFQLDFQRIKSFSMFLDECLPKTFAEFHFYPFHF